MLASARAVGSSECLLNASATQRRRSRREAVGLLCLRGGGESERATKMLT